MSAPIIPKLQPILTAGLAYRMLIQRAANALLLCLDGRMEDSDARAVVEACKSTLESDFASLFEDPDPSAPGNPVEDLNAQVQRLTAIAQGRA